jgi:hypothetical protein
MICASHHTWGLEIHAVRPTVGVATVFDHGFRLGLNAPGTVDQTTVNAGRTL